MPGKPIKRGYKIWVRADSTGYVCLFEMYTGKVNAVETALGARVVKTLTNELQGKGFHVYFDNFFNSIDLLEFLKKKGILACGTMQANRKHLPKFQSDKTMSTGDSQWRWKKNGVSVPLWKDKRAVMVASNYHDPSKMSTVLRKEKDGEKKEYAVPEVILDCNTHMGYVDKADQLKSYYALDRRSKRRYMRIFWHFVQVAVVNAFILYQMKNPSGEVPHLKEYILHLVEMLVKPAGQPSTPTSMPTSNPRATPSLPRPIACKAKVSLEFPRTGMHLPAHGTLRRCSHCSTKAVPHKSHWACSRCEVPLCLSDKQNCFSDFHK